MARLVTLSSLLILLAVSCQSQGLTEAEVVELIQQHSTPGPPGSFVSVSAGAFYSCGVRTDGSVECWDNDGYGESTPPAGSFMSVSAGWSHSCGVKTDSSVECWGGGGNFGQSPPPDGSFVSVSAGTWHGCGVKADGSVLCWGSDDDGESTPPDDSFASVSAGGGHTCGVKIGGSVLCWGSDDDGESTPPGDSFASVSAGGGHTCGVKTDGSVACWGGNDDGQSTPPSGSFASVSAGLVHSCGVKTDGSVVCWGFDRPPTQTQSKAEEQPKSSGPKKYDAPPPMTIDPDKKYTATFNLAKGETFIVELFAKEAPTTVNNFVFLARDGYYDGVTFHRVIPGFMAQGGDPTGTGTGGPGYTIPDEFSPLRRHDSPGVLSMANTGRPNSGDGQWFITFVPTPHLDDADTVFGKVVEGMEVVNDITARDPSTATSPGDVISSITIDESE